ncbi:carbonic anhydrase [Dyadobacter tibetensis]|uniref:carbonic anhydrase n=1 Tax=Dyadobacter tibetensis TaxID=1211851 RepID=UPI00047283A5|nr:carbonic anhydrase [Dyadobacter tibetensis]
MLQARNLYFAIAIALGCNLLFSCNTSNKPDSGLESDSLTNHIADSLEMDSRTRDRLLYFATLDSVYQSNPRNVLSALLLGNERASQKTDFVLKSQETIPDTALRRKPFLILTDIDMPKSLEKIFDLNESMFMQVSSPAGLTNPKQMAVMEYAVQYAGTKVILILAHNNSRIIGAACDNVQTGLFPYITKELQNAMTTAQEFADRSSANKDFVNHVAQNQAQISLNLILAQSPQLKNWVSEGKVIIKSAYYNHSTGVVSLLQDNNPLNTLTKN